MVFFTQIDIIPLNAIKNHSHLHDYGIETKVKFCK